MHPHEVSARNQAGYLAAAGSTWTPILDGALATRAIDVVDAIANASCRDAPPDDAPANDDRAVDEASLANGHAGIAILHAYLARSGFTRGAAATIAEARFDAAIQAIGERRAPPFLYEGFTGVAWTATHLRNLNREQQDEELTEVVDDALRQYLTRSGWDDDYDLVSGLAGIGVYALERLPGPAGRGLLALVVDRLDECAEHGERGVTWLTAPELLPDWLRAICPRGHYNLGMAHGVPGAIAVLAAACNAGIAQSRAARLLAGAVRWLLSHEAAGDAPLPFPNWITPDGEASRARLAWCYGSPGVAASLFLAGRAAGEPAWQRKAIDLARRAAACPPDEAGVRDAGPP